MAEDLIQRTDRNQRATALDVLSQLAPDRERLIALILGDDDPAIRRQASGNLGEEAAIILHHQLQKAVTAGDADAARRVAATLAVAGLDLKPATATLSAWLIKGANHQRVTALLSLDSLWSHLYSDKDTIMAQGRTALEQPGGVDIWREYCGLSVNYPADSREAGIAILQSFINVGKSDLLAALAATAASAWPDDLIPLWSLSWANLERGDKEGARAGFKALSERFDTAINHIALVIPFDKLGEPAKALRHARRAAELHDEDFEAHFLAGWYSYVIGDLDASINATRRALELQPLHPTAHCNLGLALLVKGEPESAWMEYKRGVAIARRYPPDEARALIEDTLSDLHELTDLSQHSRQALERIRALLETETSTSNRTFNGT